MAGENRVFLGIDLSTVRQAGLGKTCVAVTEETDTGLALFGIETPEDDDALLEWLSLPFWMCGVDAPLSLPPCAICRSFPCDCPLADWFSAFGQHPQSAYHYRLSDLLIRESVPGVSPKPPISHGGPVDITPLSMRWLRLARLLCGREIGLSRIVEVYSSGAIQLYARWFGLTGDRVYRYRGGPERREVFLEKLASSGRLVASPMLWDQMRESEDSLDAVMAALSAWHASRREVLFPEVLLGLIVKEGVVGINPCTHFSEETRREMANWLLRSSWIMLPELKAKWSDSKELSEADCAHLEDVSEV